MNPFPKHKTVGQVMFLPAVLSALGLVMASGLTAWATASGKTYSLDSKIQVVEERENNHYKEMKDQLDRIERKLDARINN